MEFIIDASVILAVLLNEPEKLSVLQKTETHECVAPGCLDLEVGNALSALIKRGSLDVVDAIATYHEFIKIPVRILDPDIPFALLIAGQEHIYAYDAYYIACAERLGLPLYTLDIALKKTAFKRGITCW